tara:strand:+ start:10672 stop:12168 length:1497 start_codon:yes stop_codon:yes gene_type:complete
MQQIPEYYGKGARLKESAAQALIDSAYEHDCKDAELLLPWLHFADLAHVKMLSDEGIIPQKSTKILLSGLLQQLEIPFDDFPIRKELGDVYNSKDAHLKVLIGQESGWLHTGRARREAVNIAYILQVKDSLLRLGDSMLQLSNTFINVASSHVNTLLPDQTYLQHAHPTTLAHYILTYLQGLLRDTERLENIIVRYDLSPAGSGSVNGSRLPLKREKLARSLGFSGIISHTRDAMWQSDLPIECAAMLTTLTTNLSRFAEEMQIWMTLEYNYLDLPDSLSRSSVIMPQKKNPYGLAYFRGLTSTIIGLQASFPALGKVISGNPDSRIFIYGDLPVAIHKTTKAIDLFDAILSTAQFNKEKMLKSLNQGFSQMTDITDYLILEERIDYRSAHQVVGKVVADLVKENRSGKDIKLDDLIKAASDLEITITTLNDSKLAELVDFKNIVNSRKSLGGASSHSINAILSSNKTSTEEKKNTFLKKKEFMQISLQKLEKECKDF